MKVGILLDDLTVASWIASIITFMEKHTDVKIAFVALNQSKSKGASSSTVYRTLRMVDRKLFKASQNPFKKTKLDFKSITILEIVPQETRFSDRFSDEDVNKIKGYDVDFIMRFGFRILRGAILNSSKYGILSLHHGDTDTYRGGPPAFWEVVNAAPDTCVTLQLLTETLDGGIVLDKAYQRTDVTGFYRNQSKLYFAGIELVTNFLSKAIQHSADSWIASCSNLFPNAIYSDRLYTNPTNKESLQISFRFIKGIFKRGWNQFFFQEQWQLILMASKSNWNQLAPYRSKKLIPSKDRIWADPFTIKKEGVYYLFFEELILKKGKAQISYFELDSNLNPKTKNPVIAIEEKFHLSYPFIFTLDDEYYCCPESAASHALTLYKADVFPNKWSAVKKLLDGTKVYDPTLIQHNGTWFLFCNQRVFSESSSDMYLHIYYSDDLLNQQLIEHPLNPIYRDARISRPSGAIFKDENGDLIRSAQCCTPRYGHRIQFSKIITLTKTNFDEVQVSQLAPNWNESILGTHTFNYADGLFCGDIQVKRSKFF